MPFSLAVMRPNRPSLGTSAAATNGTGLGAKILEAMRRGLGGEITHDKAAKGARVSLTFPLEKPDA